jgi:hypothetical protein
VGKVRCQTNVLLRRRPRLARPDSRPKGALSEAAKKIGINEQRAFEVRQIRDANPRLYQDVKAGRRSLNAALAEIKPGEKLDSVSLAYENPRPRLRSYNRWERPGGDAGIRAVWRRQSATNRSKRIKAILGSWFYAEVKASNLIQKPEESVQFAKLTDAQMLEIWLLLKRGWTFVAAHREVIERLTPNDEIQALHTRAVESGGNWCLLSVGNFGHVVVWGGKRQSSRKG